MKKTGSPLITLVKLDNELDDDFCHKFLKDEYYKIESTLIINEVGKDDKCYQISNKKFFTFISFTEYLNNINFYLKENKILKIFIPIRDKDIYEKFLNNYNMDQKIFTHYKPDIIHDKLIEEKNEFFKILNKFDVKESEKKQKSKDLIIYLGKTSKKLNEENSKNVLNKKEQKACYDINENFIGQLEIDRNNKSKIKINEKNKDILKDNSIMENIHCNLKSFQKENCILEGQKKIINNKDDVYPNHSNPNNNYNINYKKILYNKENLIDLSPNTINKNFENIVVMRNVEENSKFGKTGTINEKTISKYLDVFCHDTDSIVQNTEITNVFDKNYLKFEDKKILEKFDDKNKFNNENILFNEINIKRDNGIPFNKESSHNISNKIIKKTFINELSNNELIKIKNHLSFEKQNINEIKEEFKQKESTNNKLKNEFQLSKIEKDKKFETCKENQINSNLDKMTGSGTKFEHILSTLRNKKDFGNLSVSIIKKVKDSEENFFYSNLETKNFFEFNNKNNHEIEEEYNNEELNENLSNEIIQSDNNMKRNIKSLEISSPKTIKTNFHSRDEINEMDKICDNCNFDIFKPKRKYERKKPLKSQEFKSKINQEKKHVVYIIKLNNECFEIKIDSENHDEEYKHLHKKKDGTLDMRRKENKEYLIKLIEKEL